MGDGTKQQKEHGSWEIAELGQWAWPSSAEITDLYFFVPSLV